MKRVIELIGSLDSVPAKLFIASCLYYGSLYVSTNNRSLLLLTVVYFFVIWRIVKKASLAFFLVFLATLPFAKGKAFDMVLLPMGEMKRWALYSIVYYFPLYVSDVFLGLSFYTYIRSKWGVNVRVGLPWGPLAYFFLFIVWVLIRGIGSAFPEVGWFSALQLIRLFLVLCVPAVVWVKPRELIRTSLSISTATLLFQSVWGIAQHVRGGPLGRDIEVLLTLGRFGIRSSEDPGLLRVSGTFFEPSIYGTFLLMHITMIAVYGIRTRPSRNTAIIYSVVLVLAAVALVYSGSRMVYLIGIALGIFLWKEWLKHASFVWRISHKSVYRLIIAASVVSVAVLPYVLRRISSIVEVFTHYGSANYRLQMMIYALRIAATTPLLGVGINLSPYYYATLFGGEQYVFDPTYPHNLLFQILMETGVVGLALFVAFLVSAVRIYWSSIGRPAGAFLIGAIMYLISAMFYPIFINHQEIVSYFFVFLGIYMVSARRSVSMYA